MSIASTSISNTTNATTVADEAVAAEKQTAFGSDLVETFLVEAWEGLQQFEIAILRLREGMDEATLQDIVMLGHKLGGSSGLYGYPQIAQLCDMVERLALAVPALDTSQHKQVQEFYEHVMVCLRGSLERIASGNTEGNIGLELASLGGSSLLLSLLSSVKVSTKKSTQNPNKLDADNNDTNSSTQNEAVVAQAQKSEAITALVSELELYRKAEQETLEYFLPEVKEHLDHIDHGFQILSQEESGSSGSAASDPEVVNQLFRSAHTLKGSSYMVELQFLGDVGHALEDIMLKVREEGMSFSEAEPALHKGNKAVKEIVAILEGQQIDELELDASLQDFQRSLDSLLGDGVVEIYEVNEAAIVEAAPVTKEVNQVVQVNQASQVNQAGQAKTPVKEKKGTITILVDELEQYRRAEQETLEYFLPEVKEHLDNIDQGFYELSQSSSTESDETDPEIVNQLFRSAHTLKGSAYMVELQFLGDVGHALEDIMIKVREEGMDFKKAEPVLRKGNKVVKEIVSILEDKNIPEKQFDESLQEFQRALDGLLGLGAVIVYDDILDAAEDTEPALVDDKKYQLEQGLQKALDSLFGFDLLLEQQTPTQDDDTEEEAVTPDAKVQQKSKSGATIRASVQRLDEILDSVGDLLASRTRLQNRLENFSALTKQLEASRMRMLAVTKEFEKHYLNPQLEAAQAQSGGENPSGINGGGQVLSNQLANSKSSKPASNNDALHKTLNERFAELEFDSYSDINILAGSIAEMANDLTEMQYQLDTLGFDLSRDASEIHSISQTLRSQVGRVRMVAMSHLFNRLERLLKQGKQNDDQDIFFETIGEQVEIDNAILEAVFDPIVQLVKNSKTHGIESQTERLSKGKAAQGRITVQASYRRNSVILTIKDDGKGIDLDAVKAKAVERELITAAEAAMLSDEEARELIFSPGLSTAETLTSEAGRGVGMDIVASRIRAVKGTVQVDSEKDQGTTFTLYLPLTLLISDILLIGVGRERFAVPTESIHAIEKLPRDIMQLAVADGQKEQPTIMYDDKPIPVFHISELLAMVSQPVKASEAQDYLSSDADRQLMLILETAGKLYALMLDSIFDIEEVIIKSLSSRLEPLDFLLGTTFSSYGDIILLLDPQGLYQLGQERYAPQRNTPQGNTLQRNALNVFNANIDPKDANASSAHNVTNEQASNIVHNPMGEPWNIGNIGNIANAANIGNAANGQEAGGPAPVEIVEKSVQRLLLVDDSVSVRKVLSKKLERMGYEVTTAIDGQDAFDILLKDSNFDALLSDLEMPRMNGYELIDAVRHRSNEQTQKLPIIVMSTRARKEHVDLAKELGADDYLVKPVDESTLAQRLEQYI